MKIGLSNIFFIGIIIQIFATQGILMFNVFKVFGNWELKSVMHPLGVAICIIYFICNRFRGFTAKATIKISTPEILLLLYLLFSIILLLFNVGSSREVYISMREVVLIFLLVLIYSRSHIDFIHWRMILKVLHILVILNILFIILTYIFGPEQYMKLMTGRFVWPTDPEYKFKISNIYSFWRSPALIGGAAAVGFFGVITYFLFMSDKKYKKKRIYALILVVLSFTRSAYLLLLIFLFFKFLLNKKNLRKIEIIFPYSIPIILLFGIVLYRYNLLSVHSVLMRVQHWLNDINVNYNLLYGGAFGKVGGAVRGDGFIAILDSYWLLMLTSVGLIGIFLSILFMYEKALNNQFIKIILIAFFFTSFFVTITQSISFLVLFPLLFIDKEYYK